MSNNLHDKMQIFIKPMTNVSGIGDGLHHHHSSHSNSNSNNNNSNSNNSKQQQSTFVLCVCCDESIDNLRHEIWTKCGIAPNYQILRWGHRILESGRRLSEYFGLSSHCTIYVQYNDKKDWLSKERQFLEETVQRLKQHIHDLHSERAKIDAVTKKLQGKIALAPSLQQLNQCQIEDATDFNMSELQQKVLKFKHNIEHGSIRRQLDCTLSTLQTQINNMMASLTYEEETKCALMDKQMASIEHQIKQLENELNALESNKASIISKTEKSRTELVHLKRQHIAANKHKISGIMNAVNMDSILNHLRESKQKRFKELEVGYVEWNTETLIVWIRNIKNAHFDGKHKQFDVFFTNLRQKQIDGSKLKELSNNFILDLLGLHDKNDQTVLITHINDLLRRDIDNEFIVQGNRCCACLSKCVDCILIPCGHICYDYECAQKSKDLDNRCPICRTAISSIMKSFISGV